MDKPVIFYGAGASAEALLSRCGGRENIAPVCFVDSSQSKHFSFFEADGRRFEILPLSEALRRWPDADVMITTSPTWYADVRELLLSNGLSEDRVRFPDFFKFSPGTPKFCPYIGNYFVLDGLGYKTCCEPNARNCESTGNIEKDIAQYNAFCERLRQSLNEGKLTSCANCPTLRDGRSEEPLKIKSVNLSSGLPGGDRCNARCCYCTYGESIGARDRGESVLDIVRKLTELPDMEYLSYASGEISISPYREDVLRVWKEKGWEGSIDTNAFVYCDGITALLREGRVRARVSLDAGTAGTFAKIKGVNCWERVLENLERYAGAGNVVLKYILLEGINDNEADADGFAAIAKRIGARHVVISRDRRVCRAPMTEGESSTFERLVRRCEAEGQPCSYWLGWMMRDREI